MGANGNTTDNATNVNSSSINLSTNVTISGGSFTLALSGSGAQTPTVTGATFTVPSSAILLQVTPNFTSNSNFCNIVFTFSSLVKNVSFKIVDIDKSGASSNTYYDQVTITDSNGSTVYNASLSKYDAVTDPNFLVVTGNSARVNITMGQAGNTASDLLELILFFAGETGLRASPYGAQACRTLPGFNLTAAK